MWLVRWLVGWLVGVDGWLRWWVQIPSSEVDIDLTTSPGRTYRHFTGEPLCVTCASASVCLPVCAWCVRACVRVGDVAELVLLTQRGWCGGLVLWVCVVVVPPPIHPSAGRQSHCCCCLAAFSVFVHRSACRRKVPVAVACVGCACSTRPVSVFAIDDLPIGWLIGWLVVGSGWLRSFTHSGTRLDSGCPSPNLTTPTAALLPTIAVVVAASHIRSWLWRWRGRRRQLFRCARR